ncbi:MAG: tRNA CCA-pyrophosphorylase [Candidatus Heimdallarchaeota archaeon]
MSKPPTSLEVILTSGRTIEQGITLAGMKISKDARKAIAICFMDPRDMSKIRLSDNQNVRIKTSEGAIVVKAMTSKDAPHEGVIFMPLGIYANWITPPGKAGIGVPLFKGIKAVISRTNKSILEVEELLQELMTNEEKK